MKLHRALLIAALLPILVTGCTGAGIMPATSAASSRHVQDSGGVMPGAVATPAPPDSGGVMPGK